MLECCVAHSDLCEPKYLKYTVTVTCRERTFSSTIYRAEYEWIKNSCATRNLGIFYVFFGLCSPVLNRVKCGVCEGKRVLWTSFRGGVSFQLIFFSVEIWIPTRTTNNCWLSFRLADNNIPINWLVTIIIRCQWSFGIGSLTAWRHSFKFVLRALRLRITRRHIAAVRTDSSGRKRKTADLIDYIKVHTW